MATLRKESCPDLILAFFNLVLCNMCVRKKNSPVICLSLYFIFSVVCFFMYTYCPPLWQRSFSFLCFLFACHTKYPLLLVGHVCMKVISMTLSKPRNFWNLSGYISAWFSDHKNCSLPNSTICSNCRVWFFEFLFT